MIVKHSLAGSTWSYSEFEGYIWNDKSYIRKKMGFFEVYLEKKPHQFCKFTFCISSLKFPGFPIFLCYQKAADPSLMLLGKKQIKKTASISSVPCQKYTLYVHFDILTANYAQWVVMKLEILKFDNANTVLIQRYDCDFTKNLCNSSTWILPL